MSDLLLPEDGLLLHVGPHKTGTTAVQSAFFAASSTLREHGVRYPGRSRTPIQAVVAVTGHGPMLGEPPLDISDWERFVASIPGRGRVVVSSEFFADAVGDAVDRVVTDLGRDRVHVVVTLRPLDKIAPSQWQQYVQNGSVSSLHRWLKKTLREDDPNGSGFWRRHRHDVLVQRWVDVVGPNRVRVVVVDDDRRSTLLRTFEAMVGLPEGVLEPEPDRLNRSLTLPEVELVRSLNREFRSRSWSPRDYRHFVRVGVARALKAQPPDPGAPGLVLPRWAVERLRAISTDVVANIRASGVEVVGDLDALRVPPPGRDTPDRIPKTVPVPSDVAARAVAGAVEAAMQERSGVGLLRRAGVPSPAEVVDRVLPRRLRR